jgi:hypothetical protein
MDVLFREFIAAIDAVNIFARGMEKNAVSAETTFAIMMAIKRNLNVRNV